MSWIDRWPEWAVVLVIVAGVALGVAVLIAGAEYAMQRVRFVSAEAQIEQLRGDLGRVEGPISEDVLGQATEWNQTIRRKQRWNEVPVIQLWIPNGWDRVEVLEVGR